MCVSACLRGGERRKRGSRMPQGKTPECFTHTPSDARLNKRCNEYVGWLDLRAGVRCDWMCRDCHIIAFLFSYRCSTQEKSQRTCHWSIWVTFGKSHFTGKNVGFTKPTVAKFFVASATILTPSLLVVWELSYCHGCYSAIFTNAYFVFLFRLKEC